MHLHYRFFALALFAARPATGAEPLEGRWQGAISHAAKEWPVRIDLVREGGAVNAYLDFPAYGLYYRRARLDMARDSVRLTYISGRDTVIFAGAQKGPLFAGTWRGLGISSTFALRRLGDVPPRIVEEAVHFANGRVALAGTLVRPAGPGRSPAVVWTHGSGKQSRETDFYRDRAYLLAERGVAALIYDKRGVGQSTGDSDATLDELAGDAIAAVDYLRSRRDIKADQIGVGGFSQGGYVSPLAAARSDHIAFVVVGSAPGVSPGEQNDYAAASALRRIGLGADTIQHAMRLRADVVRFQRTGAGQSEVESAINAARSERWSRAADLPSPPLRQLSPRGLSVLDFDPARVWRQVRVPVLAMWGADDQLVPAEKSKSVIEDALMPSTRAKSTLRVFPNASHGLLVVSPSNAEWDWPRLTPGFHDLMTEWILAATKSDKSTASASQACAGCVPLPEHPRPDFQRADWQNLNGAWRFRLDPGDVGARENWQSRALVSPRGIVVPFSWAAPLSEIGDSASNVGWYERTIQVPSGWRGKRVFLVVGASDWRTTAWLDGVKLGEHQGGYTPFSFELTPRLTFRGQRLTIRVDDTPHPFKLEGKQGYGQAKGIWQTVYLEARGTTPLAWVHFTPNIDRNLVGVDVKLLEPATRRTTVRVDITNRADKPSATRTIASGSDRARFEIALPAARRWSLDDPFLHEATVTVSGRGVPDRVGSYFGMRKISVTKLPGTTIPYVSLNNSPVYLQLALDQAYHPTGYYTFPTDSFTRMEIQRAKEIGLNGLREHIKIETPRKLYWADRLGLFIMADVPNWWGPPDSTAFREHENALRGMIDRDYNHPAVFAWVMFNESWGLTTKVGDKEIYLPETQAEVASVQRLAKSLDSTRLVEDNSPCCRRGHTITDLNSWHEYLPGWRWRDYMRVVSDSTFPGSTWNFEKGYKQNQEPMINSEFGDVWGYEGSTGDVDWSWDYHLAINEFRRNPKLAGWLYTEHHDVINEWNGYWRFDRTDKETGLGEFIPGMSLRDFHAPLYIAVGDEMARASKPGEHVSVPLWASFLSGNRTFGDSLVLQTQLYGWNALGEHKTWSTGHKMVKYHPWMSEALPSLPVTMPSEAAVAVLAVRLEDRAGTVVARNFTTFVIDGEQPAELKTADGRRALVVRVDPTAHTDAKWSRKSWTAMDGLKVNGAGAGFFEYRIPWPAGVAASAVDHAAFLVEASAKQLFGKDREAGDSVAGDFMRGGGSQDPSRNPNAYPMTDERKYPSAVTVRVNGEVAGRYDLSDDPADHRGILSWFSQKRDGKLREAGSYGQLLRVPIPASALAAGARTGALVVRLEVGDALPGGLAIYGRHFGRYPVDPSVVFVMR